MFRLSAFIVNLKACIVTATITRGSKIESNQGFPVTIYHPQTVLAIRQHEGGWFKRVA
jgi:hypothetical protein